MADYQVPVVDLIAAQSKDPFQVLVATILSARTRDEITASACRRLFKEAATPEALASLSVARLEQLIRPVGFFHNNGVHLSNLITGAVGGGIVGLVAGLLIRQRN